MSEPAKKNDLGMLYIIIIVGIIIIIAVILSVTGKLDNIQLGDNKQIDMEKRIGVLENQSSIQSNILSKLINETLTQRTFDSQVIKWANDTNNRIIALEDKKK